MLNLDQTFGPGAGVRRQPLSPVARTARTCRKSKAVLYTIARAIMLDGPWVESRVINYHTGDACFQSSFQYERHSIA